MMASLSLWRFGFGLQNEKVWKGRVDIHSQACLTMYRFPNNPELPHGIR